MSMPKFIRAMVARENINELLVEVAVPPEIDFMSIDIDGNDYWIWDAISVTVPKVVIIEMHIEFGVNNIVVPYDKDYVHPPASHPEYHGASPIAMERLALSPRGGEQVWLQHHLCSRRSCADAAQCLGGKHPFTPPQQGAHYFIRANQGLEIRARLTREAAPMAYRWPAVSAGSWFCSANSRCPQPHSTIKT
jgi:hypothetical protein